MVYIPLESPIGKGKQGYGELKKVKRKLGWFSDNTLDVAEQFLQLRLLLMFSERVKGFVSLS